MCDSGQQLWCGKRKGQRKEEKKSSLAEELFPVILERGAALSTSAARD
jgi:hypothetical protein